MGCCCSEPEDPRMAQYRAARDYLSKANIVLAVAGTQEKLRYIKTAITLYGTHIRCMAVHVFKEFDRGSATVTKAKGKSSTDADRRKREPLINMALACRRITHHRATLQQRAVVDARNECCGGTYIPTDPAAPAMLAPWEWTEWLLMCKGNGDIEKHLEKMGLLKTESKVMQQERLAEKVAAASAPTTNVSLALSNNNTVSPNINVAGPTTSTNISGPSTNIQANPNNSNSNAQTGQGNVAPAVGAGPGTGNATGGTSGGANPMMGMGMGMGMMPNMMGGGSGDYAAMMQQQMLQQQMMQQQMLQQQMMQQQMAQAQGGQQGMYGAGSYPQSPMSPMGSGQQFNPYMMQGNGSGGMMQPGMMQPGYGQPGMMQMPSGSMPMPTAPASAPPAGYPAPAEGVPVGKTV